MAELEDSPDLGRKVLAQGMRRWVYVGLGGLLVGVGVLGIFLPLLPSTVFFLGAAGLFGRSSPGAYRWLTTNRWFGRHLRDYKEQRGATLGAKAWSIATLWVGIGVSEYFIDIPWVQLLLVAIGAAVTLHVMTLRTIRN
ncbi:YbaN family protein [Tepidiforma sp.]|uniref:YbaN family protein n=1 Tax=Tepidiforma sp. TaxID=2682230 RepID=UPI002ADD506F|nr:YbaN family protein [Tepidiforma sp.]